MYKSFRWMIAALLCIGVGNIAIVQSVRSEETHPTLSKAEVGLLAADSNRFRAMVERDVPALKAALADELVYVHSSSTRQSKSEHLADIEAGAATYRSIDVKEQVPYLYGKVGVIQGIATFATGGGDRQSTFTLRYTDVYIQRSGRWQMVAWHCTRIPDKK